MQTRPLLNLEQRHFGRADPLLGIPPLRPTAPFSSNMCQIIHFLTIHIHIIKPVRFSFSAVGRGRFRRAVQPPGIPPQPRLLRRPQPGGVAGESEGAPPRPV
jgi:hypothetical protein